MRESIPVHSDLDTVTTRRPTVLRTGAELLALLWDTAPGDRPDPRSAGHWRPAR